jgi:hypothetical protein
LLLFSQLLLAFLFPLAVYCLALATINRRAQPMMVPGLWDAAGLIFAASGFLLVSAPMLIHEAFAGYRRAASSDPNVNIAQAMEDIETIWWATFIVYYLLVVAGVMLILWLRRSKTVIYNVDTDRFYQLLSRVLGQLGYGPKSEMVDTEKSVESEGIIDLAAMPIQEAPAVPLQDLFEVEIFAALRNVTLHWRTGDPKIRQQIEEALRRDLHEASLDDNPAGTWIMGVAAMLFSMSFLVALVVILAKFFPARGM